MEVHHHPIAIGSHTPRRKCLPVGRQGLIVSGSFYCCFEIPGSNLTEITQISSVC